MKTYIYVIKNMNKKTQTEKDLVELYREFKYKYSFLNGKTIPRSFFTRKALVSKHLINKLFGNYGTFIAEAESFFNNEPDSSKTNFEQKTKNSAEAESIDENVRTLEDLLKVCKVDLNVWEVERHVINKWEVAAKNEKQNLVHSPLYQVKAWLKRKETNKLKETIEFFRNELNKISPRDKQERNSEEKNGFFYEVSIPDLHLAKMSWGEETGHGNYDTKIAKEYFRSAFNSLMSHVEGLPINKLIVPIGNDFFNSEGLSGATTAGTRQDDDSRWQKTFKNGCSLITDLLDYYSTKYNIEIVIVAGNHDSEKCWHLGEYLQAWYRNNKAVNINNKSTQRKYYQFGNNLLMWTHGRNEKHADLPLIMARESKDFSLCKHHYVHLGHLHQDWLREYKGIKVRVLPSLCPPDAWHSEKGYVGNKQSAVSFLYSSDNGEVANFYYNI